MHVKSPVEKTAHHFPLCLLVLVSFFIIPSLFSPAYGYNPELIKEDLALIAAEGEAVQSATKFLQLIKDAPASITVITREEIKRYGWRTLVDLLKSIREFYVTDDKNYSYLGVKGFQRPGDYNGRILALLNGHTLNDDVYQQFFMGRDSGIDLDIVDRVEIVRGPASSLYGTDAVFAIINIITKEGKDIDGLRSSLEIGSFNSNKAVLTYGKIFSNGLDILFDASYFNRSGEFLHFSEYDPGGITNNDGEWAYNLFYRARFHDFTVQLGGNDREKQLPTASYGAIFNDPREKTYDGHYLAELKYDHSFSEKYGLMIRAYDDWYRYRGYYPFSGYPPDTLNTDYSIGQYFGGELQLRWDFQRWNKLILGTEYQRHHVVLKNYDTHPFPFTGVGCGVTGTCLDTAISFELLSLYFEDEIKPFDNLILTLGARRDQYINYSDFFSDKVTPRIGLVYSPVSGTTLKFLYGQAFRAPSSFELFYRGGTNIEGGNPKPETISSYEGVWEQELGPDLSSSLSAFHYVAKDLIDFVLDPVTNKYIVENLSRVHGEGAGVEIKGRWPSGLEAYANATYQRSLNEVTQTELSNSPHVLAKGGLIVPITKDKAYFSLEEQYTGARFTIPDANGNIETVDPFLVTNLTLRILDLIERLEIQVSVFNLFNEKYFDPASINTAPILKIPQNERNFYLKASYTF